MAKLSNKNRDAVKLLLEQHSDLCDAEAKIGKRGIYAGITTTNAKDDSDFISVSVESRFAMDAVVKQKHYVAQALAKFGIQVG